MAHTKSYKVPIRFFRQIFGYEIVSRDCGIHGKNEFSLHTRVLNSRPLAASSCPCRSFPCHPCLLFHSNPCRSFPFHSSLLFHSCLFLPFQERGCSSRWEMRTGLRGGNNNTDNGLPHSFPFHRLFHSCLKNLPCLLFRWSPFRSCPFRWSPFHSCPFRSCPFHPFREKEKDCCSSRWGTIRVLVRVPESMRVLEDEWDEDTTQGREKGRDGEKDRDHRERSPERRRSRSCACTCVGFWKPDRIVENRSRTWC